MNKTRDFDYDEANTLSSLLSFFMSPAYRNSLISETPVSFKCGYGGRKMICFEFQPHPALQSGLVSLPY